MKREQDKQCHIHKEACSGGEVLNVHFCRNDGVNDYFSLEFIQISYMLKLRCVTKLVCTKSNKIRIINARTLFKNIAFFGTTVNLR